jgi:transcriptional regulator with XRE-family HTH domain
MERLRQYLEDGEITQAEFARRLGVKQPTVWEWLNGKSKPSAERLQHIARETGLSIDELLSQSGVN